MSTALAFWLSWILLLKAWRARTLVSGSGRVISPSAFIRLKFA